jgi:hypothetical protein
VTAEPLARLTESHDAPACTCGMFRASCLVPDGDRSVSLCWLCAHLVGEHGADPATAWQKAPECACEHADVYPSDVAAALHADADREAWVAGRCCRLANVRTGRCDRHGAPAPVEAEQPHPVQLVPERQRRAAERVRRAIARTRH